MADETPTETPGQRVAALLRMLQVHDQEGGGPWDRTMRARVAATRVIAERLIAAAPAATEADTLRAEVQRLRKRVHEAVDECQRRYAPFQKDVEHRRAWAQWYQRYFEQMGEPTYWTHTSQAARTVFLNLTVERDEARAALADMEATIKRVEALVDQYAATGLSDTVRRYVVADLRAALAPPSAAPSHIEGAE